MPTKTETVKNFVARNKTKIAVTATALTCLAFNQIALKQHNDFLKENGLYEAFYAQEED